MPAVLLAGNPRLIIEGGHGSARYKANPLGTMQGVGIIRPDRIALAGNKRDSSPVSGQPFRTV